MFCFPLTTRKVNLEPECKGQKSHMASSYLLMGTQSKLWMAAFFPGSLPSTAQQMLLKKKMVKDEDNGEDCQWKGRKEFSTAQSGIILKKRQWGSLTEECFGNALQRPQPKNTHVTDKQQFSFIMHVT